jgi:archaellum biogenesis ATPase FlaH
METIKHREIEIPAGEPFKHCKLGREQYANVLTEIVEAHPSGFVLALNSEWGTGKTAFVRMWQQGLVDSGYKTLYINAWENDLISDPSVAILGELKQLLNDKNEATFKKVIKVGGTIIKNVLPGLVQTVLKQYVDIEGITDAAKNATKSATDLLSESIEEYTEKKKGIEEFKTELKEYLSKGEFKRPVVFIIDELDRCRPDYAVEFLEKIKHFFSVEGIVFVLALDKKQLGNSVKGFYGSDLIDSEEYLRRFIDIEYRLPQPEFQQYCAYLYNYFMFNEFLRSKERLSSYELREDSSEFMSFVWQLAAKENLTLRQIEKLFAHSRLALKSFSSRQYLFPEIFFYLIFLRNHKPDIYLKMRRKEYNYLALVEELRPLINIGVGMRLDDRKYDMVRLIVFYARYIKDYNQRHLEEQKTLIASALSITETEVDGYMQDIYRHSFDDPLQHLFKKIELYDHLV